MSKPHITTETAAGNITLIVNGHSLVDSNNAVILREGSYPAVVYVPREEVTMDRFTKTDKVTHCPHKGDASHWAVDLGETRVEVAAWSYEDPDKPAAEPVRGYFGFYLSNLGDDVAFTGPGVPTP